MAIQAHHMLPSAPPGNCCAASFASRASCRSYCCVRSRLSFGKSGCCTDVQLFHGTPVDVFK
eukprot:1328189-Amphidinium_carterae.1